MKLYHGITDEEWKTLPYAQQFVGARAPQAGANVAFAETLRFALTDLCLHDPWLLWQYAEACEKSGMDKAAKLLRVMSDALQVVRLAEKE